MKKFLYIPLILVLLLTSCEDKTKQFDTDMSVAYRESLKTHHRCQDASLQILNAWNTAIFENKTPSGKYCSNPDDALHEVFQDFNEIDLMGSIKNHRDKMQLATSKLNNPPSDRKECYDDLVSLVEEISSYARFITEFNCTYLDFKNQYEEINQSSSKKIDRFKIKYAQLIKEE